MCPREGASGPSPSGAVQTAAEEPLERERGTRGAPSSLAWCPGSGGLLQAWIQPCLHPPPPNPTPTLAQCSCKLLPWPSPCAEPTGDPKGLTLQGGIGKGHPADRCWAWGEGHCQGSQRCGDGYNLSREGLPARVPEQVRSVVQTQRSGQSGMGTWGPRGAPWAMLEWGAVPWAGSPAVGRGAARAPAGEQGERQEPTDLRVCGRQPPQAGAREKADPLSRSLFPCPNPSSEAQQLGWG